MGFFFAFFYFFCFLHSDNTAKATTAKALYSSKMCSSININLMLIFI